MNALGDFRRLREDHSTLAHACLLGRHGRERVLRVGRERLADVLLLLLGVAAALMVRGWSTGKVTGGLEDVAWATFALFLYLPFAFAAGAFVAWRWLRGWHASHQSIAQGVMLNLQAPSWTPTAGVRCVVKCVEDDPLEHEAVANFEDWTQLPTFRCHWNIGFPSTGSNPPRGRARAQWQIKETNADGWIVVAHEAFDA